MDHIAVLADSETLLGFKLAGIQHAFVANGQADEELQNAMKTEGVGILIVSQDVFQEASAKTQKTATESAKPVVVVIPGKKTKKAKGSANLAAMVKRAIGVDIMK